MRLLLKFRARATRVWVRKTILLNFKETVHSRIRHQWYKSPWDYSGWSGRSTTQKEECAWYAWRISVRMQSGIQARLGWMGFDATIKSLLLSLLRYRQCCESAGEGRERGGAVPCQLSIILSIPPRHWDPAGAGDCRVQNRGVHGMISYTSGGGLSNQGYITEGTIPND